MQPLVASLGTALCFFLSYVVLRDTRWPEVRDVEAGLPSDGCSLVILHISDLHGRSFGEGQRRIARLLAGLRPDIVALTGDLADEHTRSLRPVVELLEILPSSPAFFVPGNHDDLSPVAGALYDALAGKGVTVLRNSRAVVTAAGMKISVVGIDDPYLGDPDLTLIRRHDPGATNLSILISHSPTLGAKARRSLEAGHPEEGLRTRTVLELASAAGFDLVLAGHTHGGQIKFPGFGALFVPGQPFPPRYVEGVYRVGNTVMFVNKGLGTSRLPVRFFSRSEIAVVRLRIPCEPSRPNGSETLLL